MNAASEFAASFQEPHVILGLRLLPLSLGRYRLLKRFDCPFVADETRDVGLKELTNELFFALLVCGLPCREFVELIQSPNLKRHLKKWGRKVDKIIARDKHFSILEKIEAFKKYLADGSEIPWKILFKNDNSEASPTHWSSSISVTLRSKLGWTDDKIEEDPLSEAMADYFKFMEGEGVVKLVDPLAYEEMERIGRANAAALEKIFGGKL